MPDTEAKPIRLHGVHRKPTIWVVFLVAIVLETVLFSALDARTPRINLPYSSFRSQAVAGNVTEISSQGSTIQGSLKTAIRYPADAKDSGKRFTTERPAFADDQILDLLLQKHVTINAKPVETGKPVIVSILIGLLPIALFVGVMFWFMKRAQGMAAGGLGGVGRSKARKYQRDEQRTTFADVAGIDEATEELEEVVDFLRHPERYQRLGGMIPKGVLLTGLPGTGKTLLARAVAGEAQVPFFSVSASEFVEMLVGVGASRVRDLFEQAKKEAPSIVFIDELDAIGRSRGAGSFGGNDEREQTLNQILTELDGFTGSEGVIVLSATNRPEVLDPALLRPGRFDRRIAVNPPDQEGRLQILRVHSRSVPLDPDLDLGDIASTTPGMVGADLRNLVNEAALGAARLGRDEVHREDFADALERILLGAARRIVISPEDRRRTAFHEAGHALIGMLEPGADPVRKVSIIPRGSALGVTFQSPDADRYGYTETFLRGRIAGMLGGRAAEHVVFGETTTGAESDLEQATATARLMVGRWGMSELIRQVTVLPRSNEDGFHAPVASPHTLELLDAEVLRITDECSAHAVQCLSDHRAQLSALAEELLAKETLDEADAYAAAGLPRPAVDAPH
ncbi:MAG: cell division protease FtsH [Solirubrobacteraceae bacterium]|jgi:cell division protease FtsH|nr:cell division protease FtsH [Solirubrobacteraceae bacterium]